MGRDQEILIIGGGVIGLSIARELSKRGASGITVVDKGRMGGESSWAAAGMLTPNAETHADDALFRFCTESNSLYAGFAAELFEETGVDIELDKSGTLYLAFGEEGGDELDLRYARQTEAGIAVERLSGREVLEIEPGVSPEVAGGLYYPDDGQVENRKLVSALCRFCEINGIELIENTAVKGLMETRGKIVGARTDNGELRAKTTVLAAGAWTSDLLQFPIGQTSRAVRPVRGQMICFSGRGRFLSKVFYTPRGYVVPRSDGRILAGATVEDAGFEKQVTAEAVQELKEMAIEICPELGGLGVSEAWAGLRPCTMDEVPSIGRVPDKDGLIVATGHFRNGILLAPLTARVVAAEAIDADPSGIPDEFLPAGLGSTKNAASNGI